MNCRVCNFPLPQGANVCPRCGTYTAPNANDPTYISTPPPYAPVQPPPSTRYGSDPYSDSAAQPPNPYYGQAPAPYMPPPIQPQAPAPRPNRGKTIGLVVGIGLLVVVLLCGGTLFLIARAGPSSSDQTSNATPTLQPTATPTPTPDPSKNPYPPNVGTLVLNDPLLDNTKGYGWDTRSLKVNNNSNDVISSSFSGSAYHVSRTQAGAIFRGPTAPDLVFSNVAFEAKLTVTKGTGAGLVFRVDPQTDKGYFFGIGILGNYVLDTFDFTTTDAAKEYVVLRKGSNTAAITRGVNQSNVVAIVANGTTLSLYVNHQLIDSVQDSTYASGRLGIMVVSDSGGSDVAVTNARAWRLP
ncbi:MAG TPA: hypothetical protein VKR06_17860 [Ktedonosporobacter sp.]|nr:hypothetical protein [Ktedonosporobacter sp.]